LFRDNDAEQGAERALLLQSLFGVAKRKLRLWSPPEREERPPISSGESRAFWSPPEREAS